MKGKKSTLPENYLLRVPAPAERLRWTVEDTGAVTLEVENTGWANRLAQVLLGRPRVSYVHLDELGSFLWQRLDGERTIAVLGQLVEARFGERAHPLYERLAQYFRILDSYRFIRWVTAAE